MGSTVEQEACARGKGQSMAAESGQGDGTSSLRHVKQGADHGKGSVQRTFFCCALAYMHGALRKCWLRCMQTQCGGPLRTDGIC